MLAQLCLQEAIIRCNEKSPTSFCRVNRHISYRNHIFLTLGLTDAVANNLSNVQEAKNIRVADDTVMCDKRSACHRYEKSRIGGTFDLSVSVVPRCAGLRCYVCDSRSVIGYYDAEKDCNTDRSLQQCPDIKVFYIS